MSHLWIHWSRHCDTCSLYWDTVVKTAAWVHHPHPSNPHKPWRHYPHGKHPVPWWRMLGFKITCEQNSVKNSVRSRWLRKLLYELISAIVPNLNNLFLLQLSLRFFFKKVIFLSHRFKLEFYHNHKTFYIKPLVVKVLGTLYYLLTRPNIVRVRMTAHLFIFKQPVGTKL